MKEFRNIFLIIILILIVSCNRKEIKKENNVVNKSENVLAYEHTNKEFTKLNEEALLLLKKSQYKENEELKDSLLLKALTLLEKAIEINKDFYIAYINRATIQRNLGRYEAAIKTLKELINQNKEYPEAVFYIGLIYEKIGKIDIAKKKYQEALNIYELYLRTPMATAQDEMNKELLLIFVEGKQNALDIVKKRLEKEPGNTTLLINKKIIEEFNREDFINNL